MKLTKRIALCVLAAAVAACALTGCTNEQPASSSSSAPAQSESTQPDDEKKDETPASSENGNSEAPASSAASSSESASSAASEPASSTASEPASSAASEPASSASTSSSTVEPAETLPTAWTESKTVTWLAKNGVSASNARVVASVPDNGGETVFSYMVNGTKECVQFYEPTEDGGQQLIMSICKYGTSYYTGVYYEDGGSLVQAWKKSSKGEKESFDAAKTLCKIPRNAEAASGYKCIKTQSGTYQETVTLSGVPYCYLLDADGTLTGVVAPADGRNYVVTFTKVERSPADSAYPVPQ